jgi:hypothetical protein
MNAVCCIRQRTSSPLTRGFAAASQPCGHFGSFTPYPYPRGFAAPSPALRGEAGELGAGHCLRCGARGWVYSPQGENTRECFRLRYK